jgi:hypothetical protein
MKITGRVEIETVTDVLCDGCSSSTRVENGGLQYATVQARWGYGTRHDGERYELHLCEGCFFKTIAYLKQERRTENMFDDQADDCREDFGLVAKDDFFGDQVSR